MSSPGNFASRLLGPYGPGHSAFSITPADATNLQQNSRDVIVRGVYVGGLGDVTGKVWTESGSEATVTFSAVPAGTVLNVAFTQIHSTNTTATLLIGLL